MVKHIVLFRLKADLNPVIKANVMREFKEGIEALPAILPIIRKIEVGINMNASEAWDIALYSEFDTIQDVRQYSADAHHQEVASKLKPYLQNRACVDY